MVVWIIGLSGAGKTTLANAVLKKVRIRKKNVVLIDGDLIRDLFDNDLSHTIEDRRINANRICKLCKFLDDQGIHVVCAILSLFPESRIWNRLNIKNYYEVFIQASINQLEQRDYKGLYYKYRQGLISNIAGLDIDFIHPENPDLTIHNNKTVKNLIAYSDDIANHIMDSNP